MHISFAFQSDNVKQYRFRRAIIEIKFEGPESPPSIAKIFPEILYGEVNPETRKWSYEFGPSITVSGGLIGGGISAKVSEQREYVRNHRMMIQGTIRWPGKNRVKWTIEEDETLGQGIPRQLGFALLVRTPPQGSQTFSARFDVRASVGLSFNPARWIKGNRDDPVYFHKDFPVGQAIVAVGKDFAEEQDFGRLVAIA